MSDIDRRTETALRQAVFSRNYRRIRDRALRRLGQEHPDQYRLFLEEERARDEAEGKAWIDISGRTRRSIGGSGSTNEQGGVSRHPHPRDEEEDSDPRGEA